MDISLVWLIAGFILIIAELMTGTFYLLVLGIAALVGAGVGYASGALVSRATPRASPAKSSISLRSMAAPSKFPRRGPPDLAHAAEEISRSAGGSMLFKIIAVVVATVLIYGYEPIRPLWIPFAIIA